MVRVYIPLIMERLDKIVSECKRSLKTIQNRPMKLLTFINTCLHLITPSSFSVMHFFSYSSIYRTLPLCSPQWSDEIFCQKSKSHNWISKDFIPLTERFFGCVYCRSILRCKCIYHLQHDNAWRWQIFNGQKWVNLNGLLQWDIIMFPRIRNRFAAFLRDVFTLDLMLFSLMS